MKLVRSYLTKNPCYQQNLHPTKSSFINFQKNGPKGITLHSVGCPQPRASAFIKMWNSPSYKNAMVHGFIDGNDGVVYQTAPWNYRCWHAASGPNGSLNNTHIGIEMCEPSCIKYTGGANFVCSNPELAREVVARTYKSAVELFAYLCKEFHFDPLKDGVILSHSEGYKKKLASGHADPEHLWNGLKMGYTMNGFRQDVKKAMGGVVISTPSASVPSATGSSGVNYKVQIRATNLRIRSAPTTAGSIRGKIAPGVYTIVEEADGPGATKWGKLKSGSGWISLDYAKRI